MNGLLHLLATLAVSVVGILVLLQVLSVADALKVIGRIILIVALVVIAACVLHRLWCGVFYPSFVRATHFFGVLMEWLPIAALIFGALVGVVWLAKRHLEA